MVLKLDPQPRPRFLWLRPLLTLLVLWSATAPVLRAQGGQYIAPGSLGVFQESSAERAKKSAEQAPWRLGPFRFEPRLALTNLGYDDNVYATSEGESAVSDLHTTVGAGLTAYSKLGQKTYFSAYAAPEYSWWRDLDELRQLNVNYGVGAFGFFNRLQLDAQATSTERERLLSSEAEIPVQLSEDKAAIDFRLELRPRLFLRGGAERVRYRYDDSILEERPDIFLQELESDTERAVAQLGVRLRNGLEIGFGVEDQRTDFRVDPAGRSSNSTSPLLSLRLDGESLRLSARLTAMKTEFDGPDLEPFEATTGSLLIDHRIGERTGVSAYTARNLVFGVTSAESTIEETRLGLSLRRELGRRINARVFAESGGSRFRDPGGPSTGREDDFSAFGMELSMKISRLLAVRLHYSDAEFDSNLAGFDRSTTRFGVGLDLAEGLLPW